MLLLGRLSVFLWVCLATMQGWCHTLSEAETQGFLTPPAAYMSLVDQLQGEYHILRIEGANGFAALSGKDEHILIYWSGLIEQPVTPDRQLKLAENGYFLVQKREGNQTLRILQVQTRDHLHQHYWVNGTEASYKEKGKAAQWAVLLTAFRELGLFAQARAQYLTTQVVGAEALLNELNTLASPLARKTFVSTLLLDHRLLRKDLMVVIQALSQLPDNQERTRLLERLFEQRLEDDHRAVLYDICVAMSSDVAKVSVAAQLVQTAQNQAQLTRALDCGRTISSDRQRQQLIQRALAAETLYKYDGQHALFELIGQLFSEQAKAKMMIEALNATPVPDSLIMHLSLTLLASFEATHPKYSVLHSVLTQGPAPLAHQDKLRDLLESIDNPKYRQRGMALLEQMSHPQAQ